MYPPTLNPYTVLCGINPKPCTFRTCAGNQAELQALATNPATRFSTFFDEAQLTSDGKCPKGYLPANPPSDYYEKEVNGKKLLVQCLKFKVRTRRVCRLRLAAVVTINWWPLVRLIGLCVSVL
jgi:hypothetical protein